jgi:hypothetical protein
VTLYGIEATNQEGRSQSSAARLMKKARYFTSLSSALLAIWLVWLTSTTAAQTALRWSSLPRPQVILSWLQVK